MEYPVEVKGDHSGIVFPVSYAMLEQGGASMLTALFQQSGTIGADNDVTDILHWKEFFGGGMGRKIAIDVAYARDESGKGGVPTRLFAKFTREFGDPLRDLFSPVMDPEVRFALLSRRPGFPLSVPRCMFADYNAEHKSGLLITERIPYGSEGIEPALEKCVDYELADPLPYYEAQTRAIAALAAYHRAGHFGAEVDREFPFNPEVKVIPFGEEELKSKLTKLKAFADRAPQLLPDGLADPAFLEDFAQGAVELLAKEQEIWRHLHGSRDAIALVHWNMNPDNGWFWRDGDGVMQSGQLDWGGVGQAHLAQAYYGMTCAGEADFLARHDAHLQALLLTEYARLGGPRLDAAAFDGQVKLAIALLGTAWMLDAPALLEAELPDYPSLTDRKDGRLRALFLPRAQLQLLTIFLSEWRRKGIGEAVRRFPA